MSDIKKFSYYLPPIGTRKIKILTQPYTISLWSSGNEAFIRFYPIDNEVVLCFDSRDWYIVQDDETFEDLYFSNDKTFCLDEEKTIIITSSSSDKTFDASRAFNLIYKFGYGDSMTLGYFPNEDDNFIEDFKNELIVSKGLNLVSITGNHKKFIKDIFAKYDISKIQLLKNGKYITYDKNNSDVYISPSDGILIESNEDFTINMDFLK